MPLSRKCPICCSGLDKTIRSYTSGGLQLAAVICIRCGLIRNEPMPTEDEQLQAMGDSLAALHRPKGYHSKTSFNNARRYLSGVAPYIKPGQSLLDIGCGDGAFLSVASKFGLEVMGVDIDPSAALYARNLYNLPVVTGTIDSIDRNKHRFDVVTMSHVLEHIPDPDTFLQNLCGLLKQNGILFIEVPNILSPKTSYQRLFCLQHHYYFCPDTLVAMLAKSGYKPLSIKCFYQDSFQVVATPDHTVDPHKYQGAEWHKVYAAIRMHRWTYKLFLKFIWRKIPFLKNIMYRVKDHSDVN